MCSSDLSSNAEVVVCQLLQSTGRLQLGGVNINDVAALLGLPQVDQVCARILSGDPNADGALDDLNGNGTPDLQELLGAIFSPTAGGGVTSLPGLPAVG